jgi:uncharacterized protein YjbI with pentapeptide repeats
LPFELLDGTVEVDKCPAWKLRQKQGSYLSPRTVYASLYAHYILCFPTFLSGRGSEAVTNRRVTEAPEEGEGYFMDIGAHSKVKVKEEDKPLKRADVERLLHEAGSSEKLNLSGRNLDGINLAQFVLQGTNLTGAFLMRANLSEAMLREAILRGAILRGAMLRGAILMYANLSEANLSEANLSEANLRGANLRGANLRGANFRGANFRGADLSEADLSEADLSGADLSGANLFGADLLGAYLGSVDLSGVIGLDEPKEATTESASTLYIRITEQPLTARNLATATSALTQLHTQCWLIATDRFADLIEYTQTHNSSFDEEANLTIAQLIHHSPAEIKFNVSIEGVANALKIAIDAVTGMWERKRELELKNTALEEDIRRKKQEEEATLASEKIKQQKALVELYGMQIYDGTRKLDRSVR